VEKINPLAKISLDFSSLPENPEELKVKGNAQLLHLALSNIVVNGCKYSSNQLVNIGIGVSGKDVLIIVKDKGIGIPKAEMDYIYDPYFRASNTARYEGYGIGLPLTRNIIKIHEGTIIVSSDEGKGTIVEVRIPLGLYSL